MSTANRYQPIKSTKPVIGAYHILATTLDAIYHSRIIGGADYEMQVVQ